MKDRVAQAAAKIVIEPLFEASFRPGAYGFRPGRSAKQAIYDIRKWVTYGYDTVIDLDLAGSAAISALVTGSAGP